MARLVAVLAALAAVSLMVATGVAAGRSQTTLVPASAEVAQVPEETTDVTSTVSIDPDWIASVSAATGITPVALSAYATASLRLRDEQPGCRLGWTTLAGIGQVETGHGQGSLDADGRSADAIHGPGLDGSGGNAAIVEGDTWDRARGPMQFIASTWRQWAADGDGDGTADVDDVDDASLAAARYLCAAGTDLRSGQAWTAAVFSYNHSEPYVDAVRGAADRYAAQSR